MNLDSSNNSPNNHVSKPSRLALFPIWGLTALVYAASLRFGFVYDDVPQILNNPRLTSWSFAGSYFTQHVWAHVSQTGTYYRPFFLLWLRLNEALFGLQTPLLWHLTTVLLHLLAIWLVYEVMRHSFSDQIAVAVATLVFALHPSHVESVAWISGCTEPLMTCFMAGSILCWLRGFEQRRYALYVMSCALFIAAILTKETALITPGIIVAYYLAAPRTSSARRTAIRVGALLAPYFAIAVIYLGVRRFALHSSGFDLTRPWIDSALTAPSALVFYVKHLLWPTNLSTFYDVFILTGFSAAKVLWPTLLVLLIAAALLALLRFSRATLPAIAWLVLPIAPAIAGLQSFDRTDVVHDRYLYLSTIGLGMLLGMAIAAWKSGKFRFFGMPGPQFVAIAALVVAMVAGTIVEIRPWQSNLTLFIQSVKAAPNSPPAFSHLAFEMYKRGDMAASQRFYLEAVTLDPNDWPSNLGLAVLELRLSQWSEADHYFQRAIEIQPNVTNASYLMQAQARTNMGRFPEAESSVRIAIKGWPGVSGEHLLLAQVLAKEGRKAEAEDEYRKELLIAPNSNEARTELEELQAFH